MSYVDQNLMAGEQVLFRTRVHWIVVVMILLRIVVLAILWFVLAPVFLAWIANTLPASRSTSEMLVTSNWIITIVFGVAILGLVLTLLMQIVALFTTEFAVTDKRVLAKMGTLHQKTIELFRTQVEGIMVEQDLLGRILGYGTLIVTGTGGMKTPFPNIAHADEFRKQVRGNIATPAITGGAA